MKLGHTHAESSSSGLLGALAIAHPGVSLELPPAAQPPAGPVVRNMLMMWSRVVTAM